MEQIADKQYCQSCGMPLRFDVEEYLGTNADHSCSDEYCYYCLKDGSYTVDISMNEMVDIWVKYTDKYNWYSGTDYTPQELRTLLNKRLPTLKRWRQKEMTQHVHYEAVNGVRTYIDQNLFHELDPEQLAEITYLADGSEVKRGEAWNTALYTDVAFVSVGEDPVFTYPLPDERDTVLKIQLRN